MKKKKSYPDNEGILFTGKFSRMIRRDESFNLFLPEFRSYIVGVTFWCTFLRIHRPMGNKLTEGHNTLLYCCECVL